MSVETDVSNLQAIVHGGSRHRILGLAYRRHDYDFPGRERAGPWRRHILANAALRERGYMEDLFRQHFPDAPLVRLDAIPDSSVIGDSDVVVLLFPDSIGLDYGPIEGIVGRTGARIVGLNGRGRFFPLDSINRRRLARLRWLEKARLPEFAFVLVAIIATPIMIAIDAARGRR